MYFSASRDSTETAAYEVVVCFSHLRWDFVYQRPQHLLSRMARRAPVIYFEEPIYGSGQTRMDLRTTPEGVVVATLSLPEGLSAERAIKAQHEALDRLLAKLPGARLTFWYYTPMALAFSRHVKPHLCVYDCMDELSAFKGAPSRLGELEQELFQKADVVFTGGRSLFLRKQPQHANVHYFPSSIDKAHFKRARRVAAAIPKDQAEIPQPRIGFFGVIDERMDVDLVAALADSHPDLHFVLIGPVVKIDEASLPRRANIHWLGRKSYEELPDYLAGWDAGFMPFALNEATRYISPTKTPEFLAAGLPVVSTSIHDVVDPYGALGLVHIASDLTSWTLQLGNARAERSSTRWRRDVDAFLAHHSWDSTFDGMLRVMSTAGADVSFRPESIVEGEVANV